jgi:hypothetical protein
MSIWTRADSETPQPGDAAPLREQLARVDAAIARIDARIADATRVIAQLGDIARRLER